MFSNTCAMTLAQKSDRILAQTRGLSGATPNATQLIEELRWALEENRREVERLTTERDEARREVCSMNETGLRMNESDKKREAKRRILPNRQQAEMPRQAEHKRDGRYPPSLIGREAFRMHFRHQRRRFNANRFDQHGHARQPGRVVAGGSA